MQEQSKSFVEAIQMGHSEGLEQNPHSYIIGLGVNYPNGADGTTTGLAERFKKQVLDVPVSEAAFTGMSVGMGTMGLNPIVHHGRMEFALLAMDPILTQAAKWNYMFGGDYPCKFAARINIGRQWGNGPQHTSSYNSLFLNTPGLNVLWPSTPAEAFEYTYYAHFCNSPTIIMEHRYLFKTKDNLAEVKRETDVVRTHTIYGHKSKVCIVTYGDGLVEALKVKEYIDDADIQIICLNAFIKDREIDTSIFNSIDYSDNLIIIETSNYQYGLMQSFLGSLSERINLSKKIKIFSPPFSPCATSPKLVKNYYPFMPEIVDYLSDEKLTKKLSSEYKFDDLNLPAEIDFSGFSSEKFYSKV